MPDVTARFFASPREESIRGIVSGRNPVVLRGLVDAWPALGKWSSEYFAQTFPDLVLPVEIWDGSGDGEGLYRTRQIVRMRADDYVASMHRPPALDDGKIRYLPEFPLFEHVPALASDVADMEPLMNFPRLLPIRVRRRLMRSAYLWWGPGGTITPLHYDFPQNLLVQVRGIKRVAMFPPEDAAHVYRMSQNARVSPVDVDRPDLQRFPLFSRATRIDLTLSPGDVLFIPFGWWHVVWAQEPSISLNYWWRTPESLRAEWSTRLDVTRERAREGDVISLIRSKGFKAKLKRPDLES